MEVAYQCLKSGFLDDFMDGDIDDGQPGWVGSDRDYTYQEVRGISLCCQSD